MEGFLGSVKSLFLAIIYFCFYCGVYQAFETTRVLLEKNVGWYAYTIGFFVCFGSWRLIYIFGFNELIAEDLNRFGKEEEK